MDLEDKPNGVNVKALYENANDVSIDNDLDMSVGE